VSGSLSQPDESATWRPRLRSSGPRPWPQSIRGLRQQVVKQEHGGHLWPLTPRLTNQARSSRTIADASQYRIGDIPPGRYAGH
jgi:hypothetical protein